MKKSVNMGYLFSAAKGHMNLKSKVKTVYLGSSMSVSLSVVGNEWKSSSELFLQFPL